MRSKQMKVWHLIAISAVTGAIIMHTVDTREINTLKQDNEFLLNAYCEMENKYLAKLDPDSFEYRLQVGEVDENGDSFDSLEGLENE
jgi:hypothetical protein